MKTKYIVILFVVMVLFGFTMSMGLVYAKDNKPVTLRFSAHSTPKGTRQVEMIAWANEIEKRTKGMVKFKFFWSDSLLKPTDAVEGIGRGTADLGLAWSVYNPAKTPLWTVSDVPFLYSDAYAGLKAVGELYKTYDPMVKELEAWNLKILTPFSAGMTQLGAAKKAIRVPDDAKGMKIRYAGGQWAKLWSRCGAIPIKLSYGEIVEALMRGTVDAAQVYIWSLQPYHLWDVVKHLTVMDAGANAAYGTVINLDVWKAFSPEIKKVFLEANDAFADRYGRALIESRNKIVKLSEEKGVTFHKLSTEQLQMWKKLAQPAKEAWVKDKESKGLPGKETQDRFLAITNRLEKEIAEKGYPWER